MKDLMKKLSAYDWGRDRGALYELDELIKNAQTDKYPSASKSQ